MFVRAAHIWKRTHVAEAQEIALEEEGDAHHRQHEARAQQREARAAEGRGHGLVQAETHAAEAAAAAGARAAVVPTGAPGRSGGAALLCMFDR